MENERKLNKKPSIKVGTTNNFITASGLSKLSLKARKLLYVIISQCKMQDEQFYEYRITVSEFANLMGISTQAVYQEADAITDELMRGLIRVREKSGNYKNFRKYILFTTCEYDNSILTLKLNPDMTTLLLNLKEKGGFSQPLLADFLRMNSPFSMAIWHLMQREMHSKKPHADNVIRFDLSLDEIREVTNTKDKFVQISDIKRFVFDKALREIDENCGVKITYEHIKEGRKIVGFRCTAVSKNYLSVQEQTPETQEKVRKFKDVMVVAENHVDYSSNSSIEIDF